jgi:hypothetical protein
MKSVYMLYNTKPLADENLYKICFSTFAKAINFIKKENLDDCGIMEISVDIEC